MKLATQRRGCVLAWAGVMETLLLTCLAIPAPAQAQHSPVTYEKKATWAETMTDLREQAALALD